MGLVGDWEHPRVWEAIERTARAARTHHKAWAILPRDPAYARRCVELGCRMLSIGIDVWVVQKGLRAFQTEYGSYFESDQP
jgi:4-hydroxy-2-oxoheptanedioate aldolase